MANRDFKVRHGLNVCGNSSLGGNVAISGNLDVGGNLSLESADLSGSLQVSGAASLGSLKVAGMTSLDGGLKVKGTMCVVPTIHAGNISASGNVQIDGTTSLKNTLTVSGLTSLQGGLVVDTSMDVQTLLQADNISASGTLRVQGSSVLSGKVTAKNNLSVAGSSILSGNVQAKGNLSVGGDLIVSGALQVGGSGGSDFSVDSPATFADTLTVSGMTSLQGGLVVDTSMDVQTSMQTNDISSSGTLFIGGSTNPHIELHSNTSGTPYIDFGRQVGGQGQDYGGRIILNGDTTLSICAQQLNFGAQNICLNGAVTATGDVCMQTVGYANQGFRAGLSAGAVGQYDTILVGSRRGAQGTGDGYASITMSPGAFGSKMDSTTSFWSVWTNKNSVAENRIKVNFGTSTENIKLKPRGQDVLVASSTSAGVRSVAICGSLGVSGAVQAKSDISVGGSTILSGDVQAKSDISVGGRVKVGGSTICTSAILASNVSTQFLQVSSNTHIGGVLQVTGSISAPGGIHAVAGNIQTTGAISGTQLKFVSAGGQRMTVSNLDSVSGRVGTLSATQFNFTSAGGQRMTISSATITSLSVSNITVNQQGNIARRISGTVASNNSSFVTAFTVVGNNRASCIEVFFEGAGSGDSVIIACYAEILVNHSGDISIRTHQSFDQSDLLDIQVISDSNEDFAVLVRRDGMIPDSIDLTFNVYPKGDETVTATSTNPYSGTTFTHNGANGTKITATQTSHRFETDGQIIGGQNLTVSGMTSLQGGLVVDTSMDVQVAAQMNNISSSGTLKVQGTTTLSGAVQAKSNLSVAGSSILSGAVQAKNTLSVGGSGTIGQQTWANGWFRIGDADAGIAMDPNEIYFAGGADFGTLSGDLGLNPAGKITTGKVFDSTANIQTTAVISGTQLRCTSFAGTTVDVAGTLQVSGSASLGSLKVAGTTCLQSTTIVNGSLQPRGELDFIGPTNKFTDYALVSSDGTTFYSSLRSMDHNSQNHHTHITMNRGAAVDLYHNNDLKAATKSTGFYVSGTLCASQDVKVGGQLRAGGGCSVAGSLIAKAGLQVSGTGSFGELRVAGVLSAQGGLVIDTSFDCQISAQFNNISCSDNIRVNGQISAQGSILAGQTLRAGGNLCAQGNAIINGTGTFKGALNVSGTLSAGKYGFEPYGVVPAYSNNDYETITYNSAESAIELSSSTDTSIGMAFPAWKPNANPGNKWQITVQIRASANTTNGVYIRVYEYDAELPDGKIAVSNTATNPLVQEDTRHNTTGLYDNQPGNTDWQSVTIEYTPTSTAVWASVVILNWTGLGTNALYVREPQIHEILENVNVGNNVQVAGHVSAGGYGHFGTGLQVSGSASLGSLKVAGTTCLQGQTIAEALQVHGITSTVQSIRTAGQSNTNANGIGGLAIYGSSLSWNGISITGPGATKTLGIHYGGQDDNSLRFGRYQKAASITQTGNYEANPVMFDMDNGAIQTIGQVNAQGDLYAAGQVRTAAQVCAAGDVRAIGQLRSDAQLSVAGGVIAKGGLQVSGTGSFGALKVAGVLSAQGGLVIDNSFDCQVNLQANTISASGQVIVDGQVQADGGVLAGGTLRAGGNLCGQGNGFVNQNFKVGGTTCLQGTTIVNGSLQPRGELDFIGATDKYMDFMLVSSNQTQYTANFRSMNHQSQGFHTHLVFNRGAAVDLYHNNNLKAATRSGGFYVSGTLSVTGDVKAGGQVRAGGALSCAGTGHFAQGIQVSGTVSCTALHATGGAIQTTGLISGTQIRAGSDFSVGGTTTLSGVLNVTNAGDPHIEVRSTASGVPYIDLARNVGGVAQNFGVRLILRGDDQFDISGAAVRIGQNTTIANGLQVVQGISCGGQLKAAGSCSVAGGGHFGQAVQVSGTISCTALHATGGAIQTTGNISGGNLLTGGLLRAGQVCAQAQCLVNNQLRVSQGTILNGTVSIKTANGTTHWNGTNQRRSVVHRNDGGNYFLLITGQQTAANVSWNSWRPWYVSLSNGENFFRRKIHADAISSSGNIQAAGTISATTKVKSGGQICSEDQIRSLNAVVCQGNLHVSGTSSMRGTVLMKGALNICGKLTGVQISCHNIKAQSGNVCQFNSGGGDFAEYFEWLDGNPNVSDRVGRSVVLTGPSGKISIATDGQTPFGVVTGRAGFVGNSATREWKNRYLRDDYLRIIKDENGKRIVNPEYNSACTYVNRKHRKEWTTIGLVGKVPVRVGEVINPNWMKLRVLTPTVEEYLVR